MGCIPYPILFKRLSRERSHKNLGFLVFLKISEGLATRGEHSHVVTIAWSEHQMPLFMQNVFSGLPQSSPGPLTHWSYHSNPYKHLSI